MWIQVAEQTGEHPKFCVLVFKETAISLLSPTPISPKATCMMIEGIWAWGNKCLRFQSGLLCMLTADTGQVTGFKSQFDHCAGKLFHLSQSHEYYNSSQETLQAAGIWKVFEIVSFDFCTIRILHFSYLCSWAIKKEGSSETRLENKPFIHLLAYSHLIMTEGHWEMLAPGDVPPLVLQIGHRREG